MAVKTPKVVVPTDKQRSVLEALAGGRKVAIVEKDGKKSIALTTAKGNPVAAAPKLDRTAVEGCIKKGWVDTCGTITDGGKKAKKAKAA